MPVALARRSLLAAASDPDSTLRAMAASGDAALFDDLLSLTALHMLPGGWQRLSDPFLGHHPQILWGLLVLAPPGSTRAAALREEIQAVLIDDGEPPLASCSLRYVGRLPRLRRLRLEQVCPTDADTLADHPGLERLELVRCSLPPALTRSLAGAAIAHLHIEGASALAPAVTWLPGLDLLRELTTLHISHLPALTDLPELAVHADLEEIRLHALPALTGVPILPVGLRHLSLVDLPWTPKALAAALCELSALEYLELEGLPLPDLGALPDAPGLTALAVRASPVLTSLAGLGGLERLRALDLSGCAALSDLSPLGGLERLEVVDLRGCAQVVELLPLVGLPALRAVAVAGSGAEQAIPAALRRQAGRSWVWSPPPLRSDPRPALGAALSDTQRAALRTIRALLHSGDTAQVEQALELARALGDPQVYASLLRGVTLETDDGETTPTLQGNRYFSGRERRRLRWALLHTLADAPPGLPEAAVRDTATTLQIEGPVLDATSLQAFPVLRGLDLQGVKRLDHPEALCALTGLEALYLGMCVLPDTVRLPPGLRRLNIDFLAHTDLSLLQGCTQLEEVAVQSADRVPSLAGLEGAGALQRLRVTRAAALTDLSALQGCRALEWVTLQQVGSLRSLAGLEDHPWLRLVHLEVCSALSSLAGLSGCPALEEVSLLRCGALSSLAGLEGATDLRRLLLEDCAGLMDIDAVQGANLRELALSGCPQLRTLRGLAGSQGLMALRLVQVSSLTELWGLEGLHALERLEITGARALVGLSALAGLTGLREVVLRGCPALSDLSALGMLPSLERLELAEVPSQLRLGVLDSAPAGLVLELGTPLDLTPLLRQPQVAQLRLSRRHFDPAQVPSALLPRVRWVN